MAALATSTPAGPTYDWNTLERRAPVPRRGVALLDETLRDGLQNPSVVDPPIADKLAFVHLLDELGVEFVDAGLPAAGPRAFADVLRIAQEVASCRLKIRLGCAGRTVVGDIAPVHEVEQRTGVPIEVLTFIGSSPIRALAEDWSLELIRKRSTDAIDFGVSHGMRVTYVTEDTTRSRPDVLGPLFRAAIDHGATRLCLCDTVGHATPDGVRNLVRFARSIIDGAGATDRVGIDWHGHNDRGFALANAIFALEEGADRVHATVLGIGERVGNTPLEPLLRNLVLLGELASRDLSKLDTLTRLASRAMGFPIPRNYPAFSGAARLQ